MCSQCFLKRHGVAGITMAQYRTRSRHRFPAWVPPTCPAPPRDRSSVETPCHEWQGAGCDGQTVSLLQEPIPHRPAAHAFGRGQDGVHVEAVVAVELARSSPTGRSARRRARARGGRRRRRATTAPRDRHPSRVTMAASRGSSASSVLDMRARLALALLARPLRRVPAGRQPVGRGHRQHADAAPVLASRPAASIASGATAPV